MLGYFATLSWNAATCSSTGRVTHPMSIVCSQRFQRSPGIIDQIIYHGQLHVGDGIIDAAGCSEDDLEVLPLHRHQLAVNAEIEDRIPSGRFALAQQMISGIDTINRTIDGNA